MTIAMTMMRRTVQEDCGGVYDQVNDGADVDDDRNEDYDYEDDDI